MSSSLRLVVLGSVVLGSLLAAAPARAAAAAADAGEEELLKQGVDARRRGDDVAAHEMFAKAYAVRHSPRAAAQMGLAEIALGRWVEADAHLEEATAAGSDPWIQKNARTLADSLARVRQEVGSLEVLGSPAGAEVVISGEVRGALPLRKPIRVRSGEVRFEVRAPGHETATRTVRVGAGELTRETVVLAPVSTVAAPPPVAGGNAGAATTAPPVGTPPTTGTAPPMVQQPAAAPSDGGATLRTTGLVLGAAGVAVTAAGLVFGLKARSAGESDSKNTMFDPDGETSGHGYETLQWIGYGVGLALIAGGVTTYVLGARKRGADAGTSLTFVPAAGGGVALLGGTL